MKNIIFLFAMSVSVSGCSQEKKQKMNTEITTENIVEKISEQVKHYPKEPVYHVYVNNSLCLYELLINDAPMGEIDEYEQQATPYIINQAILKTGKQKITLRLYPAPAEYNSGKEVFSPNTKCSLLVRYYDNKNKEAEGVEVAQFALPTKIRMAGERNDVEIKEFEGEGMKYYEVGFYFDAQVPYENEGWSKGQDLTKLDQKKLQEEVLNMYSKTKKDIESKNFNNIASMFFNPIKEQMISEYQTKSYIQEAWDEYIYTYKGDYTFMPIEKYKMTFYGDKRIVTLVNVNKQMNESPIYGRFKDPDGNTGSNYIRILLYLPEGKKLEDGLEVIR